MAPQNHENHDDEGFEALLKPIQDLTRNWDVDLSLHLGEYINYIRQICGDNIPDMNFAQAAVLVQNSATIYSKKVDFLFTTVVQLLDTLSKKQTDKKDGQSGKDEPGARRRRAAVILDTEEFTTFEEVCSDRCLTLNMEKEQQKIAERKKQKIVLNAAIKVKAKDKTSCNVYDCRPDVMGKKEEFRLNWRISSTGMLHEEFALSKKRFQQMAPIEVTVCASVVENHIGEADESHHDYDDHVSHHSDIGEPPPDSEPALTELFSVPPAPPDRESEELLREERNQAEKLVEVKELAWQPIDFNGNMPAKPMRKKKVTKLPPTLDDERKRKPSPESRILGFTVTDVLLDKYKNVSFFRDLDFCYEAKMALKHKRQLLTEHRAKYLAYLERQAAEEQIGGFPGFYNEDQDSDNDDNFEGFGDDHNDDGDGVDCDVPLPENNSIADAPNILADDPALKDDANTYDNEAMRTLEAFRSRKIDHGRMTDMARRVEEWHQKIMPKLEEAEQRSSFDIHGYGSKVLEAFPEGVGSVKKFEEIVAGETREEVCRYFLASLVLANQYNVEITETEPGDLNTDCVQLKLLSYTRHHEEMDDNLRQTSNK